MDSLPGCIVGFVDGVEVDFYQGSWEGGPWSTLPVFEELTPVRTAHLACVEEAARQPGYTALRIRAKIDAVRTGLCALALRSSGESQLLIDGAVVTVNPGVPVQTKCDGVTLTQGRHEVTVCYRRVSDEPVLALTITEPSPLILDRRQWLYIGCEGDWPKSWTFMSGALAPGRAMPPITYHVRNQGVDHAPNEAQPARRRHIRWELTEGELPIPVSTWHAGPITVRVQHVASRVCGDTATAVFTRVTLTNTGAAAAAPALCVGALPGREIPLTREPDGTHDGVMHFETSLAAGASLDLDFVALACGAASVAQLRQAGGFEQNLQNTVAALRRRTAQLAQPVELPEPGLAAMYRALQFITQASIVNTPNGDHELRGSAGTPGCQVQYDRTFSHDVPNMVEQLIFEGDLDAARAIMESEYYQRLGRELEQDYLDAIPKFVIPYATYLMHTGDAGYFTAPRRAAIRHAAHLIHEYRQAQLSSTLRGQGLYGVMNPSNTMDNGKDYLLVDNFAALHGLTAYRLIADRLGDVDEARWAQRELEDLNECLNQALIAGMARRAHPWYHAILAGEKHALLDQPGNWLTSSFMMAAFPWGASLKGFALGGAWREAFDASIEQAVRVSASHGSEAGNWGAWWKCLYGSTYNAGQGLNLLYSDRHRTMPIRNLRWLLANQSAPFQWGENFGPPLSPGDWTRPCTDYESWGLCFSRQALLQSCVAVNAAGAVIIGRGVPDDWLQPGCRIAWDKIPVTNGNRIDFALSAGESSVTLEISGDLPEGPVLLQPPILVDNIGQVSCDSDVAVDQASGTVTAAPTCRRLVVQLRGRRST